MMVYSSRTICWYCGENTSRIVSQGYSIGSMVYTSPISVSSEIFGEFLGKTTLSYPQHVIDHADQDALHICCTCLESLGAQIEDLSEFYVKSHLELEDKQLSDIADIDTRLKSWNEVVYPFGCWLAGYPDINVYKKFYSLDFAELFERGYRLAGKATFGSEEFANFLEKYATGTSVGSEEFYEHVSRHISLPDRSIPKEMSRIRAVVFDVSVWLALKVSEKGRKKT